MKRTKRIHVNQHNIRANMKDGGSRPVITVKQGSFNNYGHQVDLIDDAGKIVASVVYRPNDPLACGAKVWIETDLNYRITDDSMHRGAI